MSEIWLRVGSQNVITVRLEPNSVQGRSMAGRPALYLPLELELRPAGQTGYALVRLTGKLQSQPLSEVASFDAGPLGS
jgi:hypothetical protein